MKNLLFILISLMVLGCEKPEDRSCFKSVGEKDTKEIPLNSFNKLYMGPHLKYVLIQDTEEKVVLKGGKNLLNYIETSVESGTLSIRNKNKCNFLRSYHKPVTVEIHLINIVNIEFEGTDEVLCSNTLNVGDLVLLIRDGAGEFQLKVNGNSLQTTVTHGWGNFIISGSVNYCKFDIRGNGFGTANELNVNDSLHVLSQTTEALYVNADNCLFRAQTWNFGNILYKGVPTFLEFIQVGEGELLDNN